jgi:hypothetical protein
LYYGGLLCILGVGWGVLLGFILLWGYFVSWVFVGGFLLYLGFHVGFGCCGYVVSYGFFFVFFSCGLAELLLCILPVYLGAPYAFLMKFSYLSKKKFT